MSRSLSIKNLCRIIINIILLLTLTGCEGCTSEINQRVTAHNRSSNSVIVSVQGTSSQNEAESMVLAPGASGLFKVDNDFMFLASAEPVDDWLRFAEARRQVLVQDLIPMVKDNAVVDYDKLQAFESELKQLKNKIDAYKSTSRVKRCRGVMSINIAESIVLIVDGEVSNTIIVACVYREK